MAASANKVNLLIFILYLSSKMKAATSDMQVLEHIDVNTLFEIGDAVVNLEGQTDVILLIGGTGTGKSTLSKFIRRDQSLKILKNKADDYIFTDGEKKIGNLDNHFSKTLFPHVDKDEQSGALLVDCAGFEDTRHPIYDLIASFYTQKVFNKAKNIKIMVVESFERMRLSSDRTAFIRTIKQLSRLLKDNVSAFNGSIGLVATKVDSSKPDEQLVKSVNVFLQATIRSLQKKKRDADKRSESAVAQLLERQILLVQFLAVGDKVAIFRRPNDLQRPWTLPQLKNNFNQIRNLMFEKLYFVNIDGQNFHVSVSPETVVYIQNDLFSAAEEKLRRLLLEIGYLLIRDFNAMSEREKSAFLKQHVLGTLDVIVHYSMQIAQINSTASLLDHFRRNSINVSLIQEIDLEMRKVEFLCTVAGSDVDNFKRQVTSMYGMWEKLQSNVNSHEQFYSAAALLSERSGSYEIYANRPFTPNVTIENYHEFMTYLISLNLSSSHFLTAAHIVPTKNQLRLLNRIKTEQMNHSIAMIKRSNLVRYSGNYLLASQIQSHEIMQGQLVIMAAQKFFIDRDLTLTDTHLTIMAPIVEVVGEDRSVTLKGSSGHVISTSTTQESRDQDGKNGFSSGNVKIYTLDVVNANALTIRSIGGDGSDGQAGGNGVNGITSEPPVFTSSRDLYGGKYQIFNRISNFNYKVTAWWESASDSSADTYILFNYNTEYVTMQLTVSNDIGSRAPTNGADGGNGGAAAPPGDLQILVKNIATQVNALSSSGINGVGGQAGKAGWDAATCASADFECKGSKEDESFLFFSIEEGSFEYTCSLKSKYNCNSKFPSARAGITGRAAVTLETHSYKVPVVSNVEEQIHEYCEMAAASAALEKNSFAKELLDFIFSQPEFNSHLRNGTCLIQIIK